MRCSVRTGFSALVLLCLASPLLAQTIFSGSVPYTSLADRPAGFIDIPVVVEDFEEGVIDPRLSFPLASGGIIGPGGLTDSVDADDGVIDGSGTNGRSYFRNALQIEVQFLTLPTTAGLVWTDGGSNTEVSLQVFGASGQSLATVGPFTLGDASNAGQTAEDRYFGFRNAGGISRIVVSHTGGGMEIDHVQFSSTVEPMMIGTIEDGNRAIFLPNPDSNAGAPSQAVFVPLSGFAPHGVAFLAQRALYQDFVTPRIFNVNPAAPNQVPSISLTGRTRGNGTLAVDPSQRYALSIGESAVEPRVGEAVVIDFGVTPPLVSPIVGSLRVLSFVSAAIDFAPDGRAFVCHTEGVSVLSPPYRSVDYTMPFPPLQQSPSMCRLSRDGSRLFVSRVLSETAASVNGIRTTAAPYSAGSVFTVMPAPGDVQGLGPMALSPDGQTLLVGQQFLFPPDFAGTIARAFLLRAPFDGQTIYQEIDLPSEVTGLNCLDNGNPAECPGFEHIEVSRDGSLAVLTGNSGNSVAGAADRVPAVFVRHPFNDAARSASPVQIGPPDRQGRGAGGVRFAPDVLFVNGYD